jgi:membrane protein required for colicin V production
MNWLDVVLGLILLSSIFRGLRRGFTRQIVGLATVVLALMLGIWFYGFPAAWFAPYLSSPTLAQGAGFFLIFCATMMAGAVVSRVVHGAVKATGLSFFDHVLGAGFGALRGVLIAVAIVTGAMAFSRADKPPRAIVESRLTPYVVDAARVFASMAPYDLKQGFRKTYAQVKDAWDRALKNLPSIPTGEKKKDERQI